MLWMLAMLIVPLKGRPATLEPDLPACTKKVSRLGAGVARDLGNPELAPPERAMAYMYWFQGRVEAFLRSANWVHWRTKGRMTDRVADLCALHSAPLACEDLWNPFARKPLLKTRPREAGYLAPTADRSPDGKSLIWRLALFPEGAPWSPRWVRTLDPVLREVEPSSLPAEIWARAAGRQFLQDVAMNFGLCYDSARASADLWRAWLTPSLLRAPAPVVIGVHEGKGAEEAFEALFAQAPVEHYVLLIQEKWMEELGEKVPVSVYGAFKTKDGKKLRTLLPPARLLRKPTVPEPPGVYHAPSRPAGQGGSS